MPRTGNTEIVCLQTEKIPTSTLLKPALPCQHFLFLRPWGLASVGIDLRWGEVRYLCWADPGWCWLKHISLPGPGLTGLGSPAAPSLSWLSSEFKYISKCELSNHSAFSQRVPCQHSRLASLLNKIHVRLSPYQDWVIHLEVPSWRWVIIISVRAD